jgi:SAM-dependent methyltransferase
MHDASFEKMRAFRDLYLLGNHETLRILDVGAGAKPGGQSYHDLFESPAYEYTGLDLEAGSNVDFVPTDPFSWAELPSNSFDVVLSGQTFEHNPYFWITTAEIARVLRPGGMVAVIAPSKGPVHRYPLDCWRFYPDSWASLCAYVGLELLEGFTEPTSWRLVITGRVWGDAMMVAKKPHLADDVARKAFDDRLEAIVATRTTLPSSSTEPGKVEKEYAQTHVLPPRSMVWHLGFVLKRARPQLKKRWPLYGIRLRCADRNSRLALARGAARSAAHRQTERQKQRRAEEAISRA